ncbi:hypothetical protein IM774_07890 [Erysipelotrichaceae bacterium RD49]|nr:hypothetical protein [Erysipelotrichaceae bacterium RD49]
MVKMMKQNQAVQKAGFTLEKDQRIWERLISQVWLRIDEAVQTKNRNQQRDSKRGGQTKRQVSKT